MVTVVVNVFIKCDGGGGALRAVDCKPDKNASVSIREGISGMGTSSVSPRLLSGGGGGIIEMGAAAAAALLGAATITL